MENNSYLNSKQALTAKSEADADMKKAGNYVIKTPEDFHNWIISVLRHNL